MYANVLGHTLYVILKLLRWFALKVKLHLIQQVKYFCTMGRSPKDRKSSFSKRSRSFQKSSKIQQFLPQGRLVQRLAPFNITEAPFAKFFLAQNSFPMQQFISYVAISDIHVSSLTVLPRQIYIKFNKMATLQVICLSDRWQSNELYRC